MALPDVTGDAMRRLGRLSACGQALQEILATIPPTPLETGGQAEANVLQHHLGCSGRFREALQICAELKTEGFVVTPGDKIYLDPSVVPALLSTRKPDRGRGSGPSAERETPTRRPTTCGGGASAAERTG
ncbi:DNA helicase, partial [Durusdinium trenchii]